MQENNEDYSQANQTEWQNMLKQTRKRGFASGLVWGLALAVAVTCMVYIGSQIKLRMNEEAVQTSAGAEEGSVVSDAVVNKLKLLEKSINEYYLEEPDKAEMENYIYKGLVAGLGDPYSTYYSKEELAEVQDSSQGIYYGIGAYISYDEETGGGKITGVMPDTPAEEAGLLENDIIVKVNDENTIGLEASMLVSKIKGPEKTKVKLSIYREGENDYLDIEVERRQIESPTVTYEKYDNGMAYIRILEFDSVTSVQFEEQLLQAKNDGMQGLILDLRGNPGGNLSDVVKIANHILPKGLVVYTEDKDGKRKEYSCDGKNELQVPIVVLVNGGSASASEILAGAIKDYNKGTLLGTTTFGKGIVQKILGINDGSAVKLTVSHYYTPKGNDIHKVGIEPDEILEFNAGQYKEKDVDNQLERAKEMLKQQISEQ